jgi:DNA-binding MarR family transcriptional regulator
MRKTTSSEPSAFQAHMVELTRAFGWHRPGSTPCGQPVPIAEAHALLELSKTPGLTQRELSAALNLRKSTVSRLVTNLERRGWIARRRSEEDGRAVDVSLTSEGAEAAAALAAARGARMSGILERIPESDRAEVMRTLQTLIEAIHESNR